MCYTDAGASLASVMLLKNFLLESEIEPFWLEKRMGAFLEICVFDMYVKKTNICVYA